jgi:predicted nuclease of restriction endonuclease-like (RecB) superfamily
MDKVETQLFQEISLIIEESKNAVAVSVNAEMTMRNWRVGKLVKQTILQGERSEYGKQLIKNVAQQLSLRFGNTWNDKMLWHCSKFFSSFPDEQIVAALRRELTWTHLKNIAYIDEPLKREFYLEMCKLERWSTRALQEHIKSMLYERTALSKKPEELIRQELQTLRDTQQVSPDLVFKDPYFLDFLGLKDTYSEKDLENAILAELQSFLIELGSDFAFLARQKRITIDHTDYYIDLLFYHRRLKCLVALDLKLGDFEAGYKGQMELYLRYLEKYEKVAGENLPIGLILCSGKNEEHIELLELEKSNIRVAEYLTILPPLELLKEKLHKAIQYARNRRQTDE